MRTHKDYIKDIQRVFAQFAPHDWWKIILDADIRYLCSPSVDAMIGSGWTPGSVLHASTVTSSKMGKSWIEVYATGELEDPITLAFTIGHELAHLINPPDGHNENWAIRARMLGVNETAYFPGATAHTGHLILGERPEHWTRREVYNALRALPVPEDNAAVQADMDREQDGWYR